LRKQARWLSFSSKGHIDLSRCKRLTLFFTALDKAHSQGKTVPTLKHLGRFNGCQNIVLTMPQRAIKADPARDQMPVVVVCVTVPTDRVQMIGRVHAHIAHVLLGDFSPLGISQTLADRQCKRTMPHWIFAIRAQFLGQAELLCKL
jgi:hypothetical protein